MDSGCTTELLSQLGDDGEVGEECSHSGWQSRAGNNNNKNNNNNNTLQLGCHPVAVVILRVYNYEIGLLLNLRREGYMRSM
jgi:hypothetical protein